MLSKRTALWCLTLLALAVLAQNAWYWSQLPEKVATHFNFEGKPDAWMSKGKATIVMCGVQLGMPLFLLMVSSLVSSMPVSMVNIPHREYWLHPDRRAGTLDYVKTFMAWVAVITSLFMIAVNHLTYLANLGGQGLKNSWMLILVVIFLIVLFSLVGKMLVHFRFPAFSQGSREPQ